MADPEIPADMSPPETPEQFERFLSLLGVREAEYESLFGGSPTPTAAVSRHGRFLRVNDAYCRMLRYSPRELLQKSSQEITHPRWVALDMAEADDVAEGRRDRYTLDKVYIDKDGKEVKVALAVWAFRIHNQFMHFMVKATELRLPPEYTKVTTDQQGNLILKPVIPLGDLLVEVWERHKKAILLVAAPLISGIGFYVNDYMNLKVDNAVMSDRLKSVEDRQRVEEEKRRALADDLRRAGVVKPDNPGTKD